MFGAGANLIEKQLIGFGEVRSETLIQFSNQCGEGNAFVCETGGANIRRPLQWVGLTTYIVCKSG